MHQQSFFTYTLKGQMGKNPDNLLAQTRVKSSHHVPCLPIGCKIRWRWYLSGVRIGEADNPGPIRPPGICISAFNPTSVCQRSKHLSETSATLQVQKAETRALRTLNVRSVWSQPVEPHKASDVSTASLRGASRGTACLSKFPIRETRDLFSAAWRATGRISECYVQVGPLQIRIITLYGFAKGTPNGLSVTNFLLEAAAQRLLLNRTPTIIGGDINRPVETLKAWTQLQNQGYVELHDYAASALGTLTEPTCVSRKAEGPGTRNDTLLIDPRLVPFLTHVQVEVEKAISVHRPIQAFFQFPNEQIESMRWRLPKDFAGLGLTQSQLDAAYVEANPEPHVDCAKYKHDALIEWTSNLEKTIDRPITRRHNNDPVLNPFPGLPIASKGRRSKRRAVMMPIASPCRQDRHNDYQPPGEAVTIRSKQRVRQARRLRSLLQLRSKYGNHPPDRIEKQMQDEWRAALSAKGYEGPFVDWALKWPEIPVIAMQVPHEAELYDIVQIVEHDANSAVLLEISKRKEAGKYAEKLDVSEAYCQKKIRQVKGPQFPPVRQLTHWITLEVTPLRIKAKGEVRFRVANFEAFCSTRSTYINGNICKLIRVDRDVICIEQNGAKCDKEPIPVQQRKEICDEKELHSAFAQYWTRFWNRDNADDPTAWDHLSQHIDAFPMHQLIESIDMTDIKLWKQTRAEMKTHSSQGVCGWSVPDLKLLSDRIVQDLVSVLASYEDGWPEWIMTSRVTMLAKREDCIEENHTRPITVTSLLWRWWASTLARQVLASWANTLPPSVKGGVPNSSVQDVAMLTQLAIERAHAGGTPIAGFTLDITKCFNCIPRIPTRMLFSRLGIPEHLTRIWYGSLRRLTRVIDIGGNLSQPIHATTGLPEGCPVSVLGMAAIAWAFAISIQQPQVQVYTFYDNWSWVSPIMELNQATVHKTINFCELFRLIIDFNNWWAWGTTKELRSSWGKILRECLAEENKVPIVLQATDLGIVSHFAKIHGLLESGERIESGIRRLKHLTYIKSTIDVIGHLVQTVIWPHALFGSEFMPLGYEHFERLRTKLTEVLMRRPKSGASPWISCNALVERMQDPEEYYHTRVLQNARRYLVRAPEGEINAFHRELHEHEGNFMNIHGPVGVLKRTLTRVGWTTTPEGNTYTDRMVKVKLAETPWPLVRKLLQKSWLKLVTQKVAHRKETTADRSFNRVETAKTIAKLPVELRHTACLQIAGGYQSEARKAQWLPDHEGLCLMCGKSAPFRHILFECENMYEEYEVEGKSELPYAPDDSIWRVPIIREHESVPAKELLQFTSTPIAFASSLR